MIGKILKYVARVLALTGGSALLASCAAPEAPPLRVGISAFPTYELAYLAQELGYFREAGVKVRIVEFGELSDTRRAYEMGKIDGLATTLVEVLIARDGSKRDLRVRRVIDYSAGADVIVGGAGIKSMADLKGRRVGVEVGSLGHFMLVRGLAKAGMSADDVRLVSMSQINMASALRSGSVQAVVSYPPTATALLQDPAASVLFSSKEIPGEVVDVFAFDREVIKQRGRDVNAFLLAVDRAYPTLKGRPQESCRIMGRREGVSAADFCAAIADGIVLVSPQQQGQYLGSGLHLQRVTNGVAAVLAEAGVISARTEVADCLDPL
jgi:NitT/TauT family transport system substrate-binding protein